MISNPLISQNQQIILTRVNSQQNSQQPIKLQSQIHPLLQNTIVVPLDSLRYFRRGSDHVLFVCNQQCLKGKVLIMRRNELKKDGRYGKVQKVLGAFYERILQKNEQIIGYIPKKQFYAITPTTDTPLNIIIQNLQKLCPNNIKLQLSPQICICDNILRQDLYDNIIEFKPKSPLPDIYPHQLLQKMAKQFGINYQQLTNHLKKQPAIEKTKWFKKTLVRKVKSQLIKTSSDIDKNNEDPFKIFALNQSGIPKYTRTKLYKYFAKQLNQKQQDAINEIIHQSIHKSAIIQKIYGLQSVYVGKVPFLEFEKISNDIELLDQQEMESMLKQTVVSAQKSIPNLQNLSHFLQEFTCQAQKEQKIENSLAIILKYLISLTWRDVSIVFCHKKDEKPEIHIIDCQLKKVENILEAHDKDEKFLRVYLQQTFKF